MLNVGYFDTSPYTLAELKQLSSEVNELIYQEQWDELYNLLISPRVQNSHFKYNTNVKLYDDLVKIVDKNANVPEISRVISKNIFIWAIISLLCGLFVASIILFLFAKYFSFGGNNIKARRREEGCKALKARLSSFRNVDSNNYK